MRVDTHLGIFKRISLAALLAAGALAAGAAQARTDVHVQWSVNIGGPVGVAVHGQPRPPVVVAPVRPVVVVPPRHAPLPVRYLPDRDRDGIPDRYDRVYNPPGAHWGRGAIPHRHDHHRGHAHGRSNERDRGAPDRHGPQPGRR